MTRYRFKFVVVLSFLASSPPLSQAQSTAPASDKPAAPVIGHPRIQDPAELTTALLAMDPAQAVILLTHFACASVVNIEGTAVVRQAWDRRDAPDAAGALKDPTVRTLLARCLAEFKPRFTSLAPENAPVLAQLRLALGSSDPDQVRAAARGLTNTATAEDVKALMGVAERLPSLRLEIVSNLGQICRVDAIDAANAIEAGVKDERERSNIDNIIAHSDKTRRLMCGYDANIVGREVSQADIEDFTSTHYSGPDQGAVDIQLLLTSTNIPETTRMVNQLHCRPDDKDIVHVVEDAWRHRNAGPHDLATRDFTVRVLMAKCLVDAHRTDQSKIPASAIEQLRQAVKSGNHFDFIVAVNGLARIATPGDIKLIERSTTGRPSTIASMVVQTLTQTCAPGAQQAVAAIRERTTKPQAVRAMDYAIGATKRVREHVCSKNGINDQRL